MTAARTDIFPKPKAASLYDAFPGGSLAGHGAPQTGSVYQHHQYFDERRGKLSAANYGGTSGRHICSVRPNAARTLSCIASLIVGCGKTVPISSASVVSNVLPIV